MIEVKATTKSVLSGFKGGQRLLSPVPVPFEEEHLEIAKALNGKVKLLARKVDGEKVVVDWCDLADEESRAKLFAKPKKKATKSVAVKESIDG